MRSVLWPCAQPAHCAHPLSLFWPCAHATRQTAAGRCMLSKGERLHIGEGIRQGIRTDGRSCSEYRPLKLELGVLPQASGSARCQLGATDVLVGVKVSLQLCTPCGTSCEQAETLHWQAELGTPLPGTPDQGGIQFAVECSPCGSVSYQVCQAPCELSVLCVWADVEMSRVESAQRWSLSTARPWCTACWQAPQEEVCAWCLSRVSLPGSDGAAGSALDLESLCIVSGKTCWVVCVDGLVLNADGSVVDALSIAVKVARGPAGRSKARGKPEVPLCRQH